MKFVAKYGILIHKRHCGVCGPNFRVLGRKYNENEDAICVETISEKLFRIFSKYFCLF